MTIEATVPNAERQEPLFARGRSGRMVSLGGSKVSRDKRATPEQIQQVYDEAHKTSLKTIRRHREELLGSS